MSETTTGSGSIFEPLPDEVSETRLRQMVLELRGRVTDDATRIDSLLVERTSLADELREAQVAVERATDDRDRAQTLYGQLSTASRDFKAQVRALAIDVALRQGWCDEGLNEALESLGLEPHQKKVRGEVMVRLVLSDVVLQSEETADDALLRIVREVESNIDSLALQDDEGLVACTQTAYPDIATLTVR